MVNVSKYDIAFISVRLLAIYLLLGLISGLPKWVMAISMVFSQPSSEFLKLLIILLPILSILIPIFLWVLSSKIAFTIINTQKNRIDNDNAIERSNTDDLQTILFRAIGIFILVTTIPQLIAWIYTLVSAYINTTPFFEPSASIITLIVPSLKILLSATLILTAKNLSMFFYKLRNAGFNKN